MVSALQKAGKRMPCPRCGQNQMNPKVTINALSRYADVYICDTCGLDEAMRDFVGQEPVSYSDWSAMHWEYLDMPSQPR